MVNVQNHAAELAREAFEEGQPEDAYNALDELMAMLEERREELEGQME